MLNVFHEKGLSIFLAVIISLTSTVFFIIGYSLLLSNTFSVRSVIVTQSILLFAAVYFLLRNVIREFITNRIIPIYQMVANKNMMRAEIKEHLRADGLAQVKTDVTLWAMEHNEELSRLHQNEQFRHEFVGNVSHEIKTPIFNIQGYILTLLDGAINDPLVSRKYLENTEKNINRLINIVEDLNAISRLERGEMELDETDFDIVRLANESIDTLRLKAKQNNIALLIDPDPNQLIVSADRKRISQVLVNLLGNAVGYGKPNGKVSIGFTVLPQQVIIEVSDNGIGMDSMELSRIFERFYRVDRHRSRAIGGSGLGLSIVKHIIEAHKQTINVRSNPGKGSSFAFTLKRLL